MGKNRKPLEMLDAAEWESLCERCARCCYEKLDFNGRIYYTRKPCDQLDLKTGLCKVYEQRDRVRPDCQRLAPETVAAGILPGDCPYAKRIKNYKAPMLGDHK